MLWLRPYAARHPDHVALLGQAQRIAASAGVPFAALMDLVSATVDNVAELGPAKALTGPAARGDEATISRHLAAIRPAERPAYQALAQEARRLAAVEPRSPANPVSTCPTCPT